jgi:hypothetical protein
MLMYSRETLKKCQWGGGQVSDRMLVWVDGTKRRNVSADG